METSNNNLPSEGATPNTNVEIKFSASGQPNSGTGLNESAPTGEPNASSPLSEEPVREERRIGRVGFSGLGQTDKTPTFGGVNSQLDNALHNDIEPKRELVKETPAHRRMIELSMQGFSNKEIAGLCDCTPVTVANVLRQPWARERVIKDLKQDTLKDIRNFLEQQAMPSLEALVKVRESALSKPSEVTAASNALLDRFMGKPNQPITNEVTITKPEELTDIELAALISPRLSRS